METWIVVLTVGTALVFDFTNGFHDTANAMATTIATRALPPRGAVGLASILNFAGAFISVTVAATIASGIVEQGEVTVPIVFAGLVGAILWNGRRGSSGSRPRPRTRWSAACSAR
jgi:inorganic phosphate transporter, PiT family